MKPITYKGRICRPTMKTHSGVKERHDFLNMQEIQRHCNEFLRGRGIKVGMTAMIYGKGER